MESTVKLSIILPAYNEEIIIGNVLDEIRSVVDVHEIIVVDDGSDDKTADVARAHGAKVVRHPYNIGNGAAVKNGIRAATGDIIVLLDADGQHPPADIPRLISYIGDYDMVVGARTAASDTQIHRDVANSVFNRYASYITGHRIPDLTSGFRAIKTDVAKRFVYLLPNGYSYPTTITITMFRSGYRVRYEPIVAQKREGRSKVRPIRDGLRFLLTITRMGVLFVPMKIFLPISAVMLFTGTLYGLYLLIFEGRFTNMTALLIIVGVMVFLNGLIAEQIALQNLRNTTQ